MKPQRDLGRGRRRSAGFTMFELLFVMALMSVIGALLAPGMRDFVVSQRVKSLAYDLASDLMLARSEALKRNAVARVDPHGAGLETGWTVSAGNTVLGWRSGTGGGVVVEGAPSTIQFNASGRVSAPATQLRMTIRHADGDGSALPRCVELDLSGRVHQVNGACP